MFTTFETLFLMAIDDEEGNLLDSAIEDLDPALAGAVLAELALTGRIKVEDGRVAVVDSTATENPILDHALDNILETGSKTHVRKIKYWINTLTYGNLRSEIGQYLVEKGVLIRKKKHLCLVIPFGNDPKVQASAKYGLKNRMREIVLAGVPAGQNELIQLALLFHSGLLTLVFTPGERKAAAIKVQAMIAADIGKVILDETLQQIISVSTRYVNV